MTEQIGRVLGGRYRLLSPLGSGASAQVYLADDVRLRRRVAVKVLHPALADDESFLRRFRAEAQSAASLSHPHLLAVYDWNGDGDAPFLVTEYLSGGSLRALLDAGHRLSPSQALVVGLEAARALAHAHREGFVHRDVKPANLLFGHDGRLRVADFGLARAIAEAGWTETGAVLGTARYASPEQARGETVDGRSDVYSLALVLVEAVTGQVPFSADTTIGTLMARLDTPLAVPPQLGPLAPVLIRAGHHDRAQRIDAATLAEGLVAAAPELTEPASLPLAGDAAPPGPAPDDDATLMGAGARRNGAGRAGVRNASDEATALMQAGPPRLGGVTAPPPYQPPAAQPWGTAQQPAGPRELSAGDRSARRLMIGAAVVVTALAVGLVGGWLYVRSQVPTHVVPTSLVGLQQTQLAAEVGSFGWTIEIEEVRQDGTDPGEIVATRPEGGTDLREGATLVVVVSQGGPLVDVPEDLAGMTSEDAVAALEAVGLVPELVPQRSEQVDDGLVIGYAEGDPGPQAPKGTTIALAVSTGDEIEVPDLAGRPYEEVVAELERIGLSVEVEGADPDGDDFAVGEVMGTDPEAGDEVDPGDTVTVIVAVDQVHVPTVGGMTLDEATQAIEGEGLSVGRVRGPDGGRVFLTWPLEGSEVGAGSSVDLMMRPD
jgi:beta-lactam-binding protein with PASTA domain/tRNA A-37 threonylcarbamoyl transferase component Bud32